MTNIETRAASSEPTVYTIQAEPGRNGRDIMFGMPGATAELHVRYNGIASAACLSAFAVEDAVWQTDFGFRFFRLIADQAHASGAAILEAIVDDPRLAECFSKLGETHEMTAWQIDRETDGLTPLDATGLEQAMRLLGSQPPAAERAYDFESYRPGPAPLAPPVFMQVAL